ncbi:MAG: PqqD family protein [Paenibacillus sp.]|nr:PqqD family protein [Paenibacillus sp.]
MIISNDTIYLGGSEGVESGKQFALNDIGIEVIRKIDGERTVSDIIEYVQTYYLP